MPSGIYNRKPLTQETKDKISKANKGKLLNISLKQRGHKSHCPCAGCKAQRGELRGKNSPSYGIKRAPFSKIHRKRMSKSHKGIIFTETHKLNISKSKKGRNSHFFIHGKGRLPYTKEFNEQLKFQIRKRDNYTCQNCGITEKEYFRKFMRILGIHHIDYDKNNCEEWNLITTCSKCNSKANYNRDYWFAYYTYIMENEIRRTKNGQA